MLRKRLSDDIIFWIIVIDLCFIPYFNIVVIPYSYIVMLYWLFTHRYTVKRSEDFKPLLLCVVLMCFSTMWGAIRNAGYGVNGDNIKRLVQYTISFGYLFFFRHYFKGHRPNLKGVLWLFVLFIVGLAVLFRYSPFLYSTICSIWNKGNAYVATSFVEGLQFGYTVRYGFIWTDQNNIAYAITGVILFMIMYFRCDIWEKMILLLLNVFVLFCSMSSGGWIGFAISWMLYLVYALTTGRRKLRRSVPIGSFFRGLIVIGILLVMINQGVFSAFLESDLAVAAIERFENNENSRTEIWLRMLRQENIFTHVVLGAGSTIIINGVGRAAHSGHLYWIYAYGMISYGIFLIKSFWLGFRKLYRYIPVLSFFLCFTMNTMVGEQKLLLIYFMIFAYLKEDKDCGQTCKPDYSGL